MKRLQGGTVAVNPHSRRRRPRLFAQFLALRRYTPAVHRCHGCARRAAFFLCDDAGSRLPKCFGGYCHFCAPQQPAKPAEDFESEPESPFILGFDEESAPLMTLIAGGVAR